MILLKKILLSLMLISIVIPSCKKDETVIDNVNIDYRDAIIGEYHCISKFEYWNTGDTFLSYKYDTANIYVTKDADSDCIEIPGIYSETYIYQVWNDDHYTYRSIVGGGSMGGGYVYFFKNDSVSIWVDCPGLGPCAYYYYGNKKK
jgi:hypothetical protein